MLYEEKMNYIFNKITDLPEKIQNEFLVDALFYRIHTSIEAVMDIIAMLCKDFGLIVEDDYSNISYLERQNIISEDLAEELKRLNSLRNVITHRYKRLDVARIVNSVPEIKRILLEFVEVTEDLLRKIFEGD